MSIAEEALMAYADGTLPAEERPRVEAALATDPALARQVALLRAGGQAARDAFASVLEEPVPPRLLAAIAAASGPASPAAVTTPAWEAAAPRQGQVGPRPLPAATRASRPAVPWFARRGGLAIAASLLLGVFGGWTLHGLRAPSPGGPGALGPALQAALERAPSGTTGGEARLIATHRAADGQVCRSFAVPAAGMAGGGTLQGLACRGPGGGEGGWALRAMVARGAGGAGSFAPASAEDPVLAEVLDRLGAGPALTEQEERAAMARGWSPAR